MGTRPAGRPSKCGRCGDCDNCKRADYMRERWARMTPEQRRAEVARRDAAKVRARDRARARTEVRKRHAAQAVKTWRAKHPERQRAHQAVRRALRTGELVKGPCELADDDCLGPIHAHHDDYDEPLDVRWLCAHHHHVVEHGTRIVRDAA